MGLARKLPTITMLALAMIPLAGMGQELRDPTRPPAGFADPTAGVAAGGPVLQSVVISPQRKAAIISGQTVELGARYGESRLVRVSETEAVLRGSSGTQVLKLYPDVEMKPVKSATPKQKPRAAKKKPAAKPAASGQKDKP